MDTLYESYEDIRLMNEAEYNRVDTDQDTDENDSILHVSQAFIIAVVLDILVIAVVYVCSD